MKTHATRARRAAAGVTGAIIAVFVAFSGAAGANATQTFSSQPIDPSAVTEIVVHKFEEPTHAGMPANGLPQDTTGLTPVDGATFTATRIPDIDLTTNDGQKQAGELTVDEAAALVVGLTPDATGTTGSSGNPAGVTTLQPLSVGLYLVSETSTPAGYVGAAPFLVALPLTHPTELDGWLTTVHVYPKNAKAGITLAVNDQNAVQLGDTVKWVSTSTIPSNLNIDGYQIDQIINPNLELVGLPGDPTSSVTLTIDCEACASLVAGEDYAMSYAPNTKTLTITMLDTGLQKLESAIAAHPAATVKVQYETVVLAEGVHTNEAVLYPSKSAIEEHQGVSDTATTKWGPLSVLVNERGNPSNVIAGACFMIFASAVDAQKRQNPIEIDGVNTWVTDSQGRFVVQGLRFSDFANNLDRDKTDPLYRNYWAVPVCLPPGWTWVDDTPIAGSVNDVLEFETLNFLVKKSGALPVTGGQMAGAGLLLALVLGGAGLTLMAARKRKKDEATS